MSCNESKHTGNYDGHTRLREGERYHTQDIIPNNTSLISIDADGMSPFVDLMLEIDDFAEKVVCLRLHDLSLPPSPSYPSSMPTCQVYSSYNCYRKQIVIDAEKSLSRFLVVEFVFVDLESWPFFEVWMFAPPTSVAEIGAVSASLQSYA
jgi:hypothetical protein